MRRHRLQGLVLALLLGVVPAVAGQTKFPRLDFTDQRLENGLRVIIAPDHSAPVFAIAVTYNVGSAMSAPARPGLLTFSST